MIADEGRKILFDQVKARIVLHKNGYKVEDIVDPYLNYIVYKDPPSMVVWRSALKKLLLVPRFVKMPSVNTTTFFTFPEWTSRKDYLEILDFVGSGVRNKFVYRLSFLGLRLAFSFQHLKLAISKVGAISELSIRDRVYITAAFYNALMTIDHAEKNVKVTIQKYVSFCCVIGMENILTQYFKKRGIPTYNLQHGITFLYQKNLLDELEYRNLITDHHLAWGDYTRDELIKYGVQPGKVLTAGYPRKISTSRLKAPSGNNCIVFLSRADFKKENIKLLEVLSQFNKKRDNKFSFHFKLHPSLNSTELKKIIHVRYRDRGFYLADPRKSLHELLKKGNIDFGIVVNSTAYYECYIHGVAALRFKDPAFDMSYAIVNDAFEDVEGFSVLINHLYEGFEDYFNPQTISKGLNYVMGLDRNEYQRLLS